MIIVNPNWITTTIKINATNRIINLNITNHCQGFVQQLNDCFGHSRSIYQFSRSYFRKNIIVTVVGDSDFCFEIVSFYLNQIKMK